MKNIQNHEKNKTSLERFEAEKQNMLLKLKEELSTMLQNAALVDENFTPICHYHFKKTAEGIYIAYSSYTGTYFMCDLDLENLRKRVFIHLEEAFENEAPSTAIVTDEERKFHETSKRRHLDINRLLKDSFQGSHNHTKNK